MYEIRRLWPSLYHLKKVASLTLIKGIKCTRHLRLSCAYRRKLIYLKF